MYSLKALTIVIAHARIIKKLNWQAEFGPICQAIYTEAILKMQHMTTQEKIYSKYH